MLKRWFYRALEWSMLFAILSGCAQDPCRVEGPALERAVYALEVEHRWNAATLQAADAERRLIAACQWLREF